MKSLIKTAMLLAALTTVVKAEGVGFTSDRVVTNPLKPAATGVKNLFATEKLEMEHTVGISFGTGANRFSQYYLNTMTYKICEPLTIQATLGIQNQTLGSNAFAVSTSGTRVIIPKVGILYQPRPNLRIQFSFSNTPYQGYGYDPYWTRYGY